jgi:hypothetical protein
VEFAAVTANYSTVEARLRPGTLVAFHGHSGRKDGAGRLVDHLVDTGAHEWVAGADSLVVTRFVRATGLAPLHGLLERMDGIDGWLSRDEAAFLALLTADGVRLAPDAAVVEVGSYCGRGTVVLAGASAAPGRGRVHAVDRFDGVVGSAPAGLHHGEPTWERFRATVRSAGLGRRLRMHRARSADLDWQEDVALLVVDGWHDYVSVRADVDRFAGHVVVGGLIAFHDAASYAPDVGRVLGELLDTGDWVRVGQVGTLAAARRSRPSRRTGAAVVPSRRVAVAEPVRVSCLMPTGDRAELVLSALAAFDRQDHAARELVVVDDGSEPVAQLVADHPLVTYLRPWGRLPIGATPNLAAVAATGDYLAHWDDDDWYAPHRLSHQLAVLQRSGRSVVGCNDLLYREAASGRVWRYVYPGRRHGQGDGWAHDATLLLERSLWRVHPYPGLDRGLDARWLASLPAGSLVVENEPVYVGLMHSGNTSCKDTSRSCWQPVPQDQLDGLLDGCLDGLLDGCPGDARARWVTQSALR